MKQTEKQTKTLEFWEYAAFCSMGSYISSLAGYCEKNLVTHLDKCFVDMREPEVIQQSHLCTGGSSSCRGKETSLRVWLCSKLR